MSEMAKCRTNQLQGECRNVFALQWLNLLLQGHSFITRLGHSGIWPFAHCRQFAISDICDICPLRDVLAAPYRIENVTVTVMMMGIGVPLRRVGE